MAGILEAWGFLHFGWTRGRRPEAHLVPWRLSTHLEKGWRRAVLSFSGDEIMSVAVKRSAAGLEFGLPKALFQTRTLAAGHILGSYDVSPDGQRFLVGELVGEAINANPAVILNWTMTLPR